MKTIVCIGEALIDFVPVHGQEKPFVGGAPLNVAAAFSKCGGTSRLLTKLAKDPLATLITTQGMEEGIDFSSVVIDSKTRTAYSRVEIDSLGDRHFSFSRKRGSFLRYRAKELPKQVCAPNDIFYFGTVSMLSKTGEKTVMDAVKKAKSIGALIAFDPNIRLTLFTKWNVLRLIRKAMPYVDVLKLSEEEALMIAQKNDSLKVAQTLLKRYPSLIAIALTKGANGAAIVTHEAVISSAAIPVKVVDTIGAGDGFFAAFLYKSDFSRPSEHKNALMFALGYAAKVCAQQGALPMPNAVSEN